MVCLLYSRREGARLKEKNYFNITTEQHKYMYICNILSLCLSPLRLLLPLIQQVLTSPNSY